MNVKLLLVDDHPLLRQGLRDAVSRHSNVTLAGEASTGEMALKMAQELAPDVVLMDKEIAGPLGVSPSSVETYRFRLMKKLGCQSTAELARYAIREGIAKA